MVRKWSGIIAMVALSVYIGFWTTGCISDVGADGTKETSVLGAFPVSEELPASAGLLESPPWLEAQWVFLTSAARLAQWDQWNADHAYVPAEKPSGPIGDTSGIGGWLASGYAVWLAVRTLATNGGKANARVVISGGQPLAAKALSLTNLLTGLASSPPEAIVKRAQAEVKIAAVADTAMPS